jgi:hypothetical protein
MRPFSEAVTMALYVCLVLTGEFVILSERDNDQATTISVIWGTTIGLTLAHVFAFDLSERLFSGGRRKAEVRQAILLQLVAAAVVAVVLTIPVVVFDLSTAFDVCASLAALFVGLTAFGVARTAGRSWVSAGVFGLGVLAIAVAVVAVKVALSSY